MVAAREAEVVRAAAVGAAMEAEARGRVMLEDGLLPRAIPPEEVVPKCPLQVKGDLLIGSFRARQACRTCCLFGKQSYSKGPQGLPVTDATLSRATTTIAALSRIRSPFKVASHIEDESESVKGARRQASLGPRCPDFWINYGYRFGGTVTKTRS